MVMKAIKYITLVLMVTLSVTGCRNLTYEKNIKKAYANLKIGMTKNELDDLFEKFEFLKEQTILLYQNSREDDMRDSFKHDKTYNDLYPKDLLDKVTFEGNIIVYTYLIRKKSIWPNGLIIEYVAIFYDKKDGKVIGRAEMSKWGEARTWGEKF